MAYVTADEEKAPHPREALVVAVAVANALAVLLCGRAVVVGGVAPRLRLWAPLIPPPRAPASRLEKFGVCCGHTSLNKKIQPSR